MEKSKEQSDSFKDYNSELENEVRNLTISLDMAFIQIGDLLQYKE
jgi:hypothetical protein